MSRPATIPEFLFHAFYCFSSSYLRLELVDPGDYKIHKISLRGVIKPGLGNRDKFYIEKCINEVEQKEYNKKLTRKLIKNTIMIIPYSAGFKLC